MRPKQTQTPNMHLSLSLYVHICCSGRSLLLIPEPNNPRLICLREEEPKAPEVYEPACNEEPGSAIRTNQDIWTATGILFVVFFLLTYIQCMLEKGSDISDYLCLYRGIERWCII